MRYLFAVVFATMLVGQAWATDKFKIGDLYYSTWFGDAYVECENDADNYANNYSGLTTVTIPDKVEYDGDEYPVVGISREAFKNCTSLTTITFPNSLQQIEEAAFYGCSNLKSVVIPNSETNLRESIFQNCTSLESVTLPSSITEIPSAIFGGCTSLTTIEIPNTVTFIGNGAFSGSGLTSIEIPASVTEIASFAFQDCDGLETITIPATVEKVQSWVFRGCDNLTINCCATSIPGTWSAYWNDNIDYNLGSCGGEQTWTVTVSANNSSYGSVSGGGTYANGSTVTITATPADSYKFVKWSNGLTTATATITVTSDTTLTAEFAKIVYAGTCGDDARWSFSVASKTLTISGTGSIDKYKTVDLFSTEVDRPWQDIADQIEKVVIGEGITNLGSYAFCYCNNLEEVNISSTCNSYGSMSFANCPNLKKLVVAANSVNQANEYCFSNYDNCTLYVPVGKVDYYKKDIIFGMFKNIVGGYLVTIDADIMCGTVDVESYIVPEGGKVTVTPKPNEGYSVTDVKFEGKRGVLYIYGDYIYSVDDVRSNIVVKVVFSRKGVSGFTYKVINGTNIEITKYKGTDSVITIPSKITDNGVEYTVTSIGNKAFYDDNDVKSITIPNTVTNIGESAFAYTDNLISLTIPNSVKTIGDYAFSYVKNVVYNGSASGSPWGALTINGTVDGNCIFADAEKTHLTAYLVNGCLDASGPFVETIDIPESVISIGWSAFRGEFRYTYYENAGYWGNDENPYLILNQVSMDATSCKIHSDCKYILGGAFTNKSELESVTIPNSVKSINQWAFFGCENLASVTIPEGVVRIGKEAFSNCDELTKLTIPGSVKSIGEGAFWGCDNLNSLVISDGVETIGNDAFGKCEQLSLVSIAGSVKTIGDRAFCDCINLSSATISDGVERIGEAAFYNCRHLESLNIPKSVTEIGERAFDECYSLTIYSGATEWPAGWLFSESEVSYVIFKDNTAVAETIANAVNIYAHGNTIVIENATDVIRVYDAMGRLICRDVARRVSTEIRVNSAGVYIVKVGTVAKRVMVND